MRVPAQETVTVFSILPAFPSEVVEPNAAQTLVAIGAVSLLLALLSATALGVVRAVRLPLAPEWRWGLAGIWVVSTLGSVIAATSTSAWGVTIAAAVSLPLLSLVSRTAVVRSFLVGAGAVMSEPDEFTKTMMRSEPAACNRKEQS
ncbi:hypothetical protein [Microbacterium sp. Mcb102]|uniref:hypothetical protein n=1 Tax=Microbacterium sp. Mcb102 TaxID=2926012 RepID=UPI0021C81EAC|nr:hypothetical protein [Microbacterium sp. Mcb102]